MQINETLQSDANAVSERSILANWQALKLTKKLTSYGNYCGYGNKGWNKKPIDNLDAACRKHDKCYNWVSPLGKKTKNVIASSLTILRKF